MSFWYRNRGAEPKRAKARSEAEGLSRVDGGFVDEENWNVIAHRVDAAAGGTLQAFLALSSIQERRLAGGTNQDV